MQFEPSWRCPMVYTDALSLTPLSFARLSPPPVLFFFNGCVCVSGSAANDFAVHEHGGRARDGEPGFRRERTGRRRRYSAAEHRRQRKGLRRFVPRRPHYAQPRLDHWWGLQVLPGVHAAVRACPTHLPSSRCLSSFLNFHGWPLCCAGTFLVKTLAPSHIAEGATADLYQVTALHRNNRLIHSAGNGDFLFCFCPGANLPHSPRLPLLLIPF